MSIAATTNCLHTPERKIIMHRYLFHKKIVLMSLKTNKTFAWKYRKSKQSFILPGCSCERQPLLHEYFFLLSMIVNYPAKSCGISPDT